MISWSVVIRILALVVLVSSICDVGWHKHGIYCYYFSTEGATFSQASAGCVALSAQLAYIDDVVENFYLYTAGVKPTDHSYWIGLERILGPIWRWRANGQAPTFNGWDLGEPDGEGDCARMAPYGIGLWRDMVCDANLTYICKKDSDCGNPPTLDYTTITTSQASIPSSQSDLQFYSVNTVAEYKCQEGYEFVDRLPAKTSTCSLGGVWFPNLNQTTMCEKKMCKPPPLPENMHYNGSDQYYEFGSIISYRCFEGYRFSVQEFNLTKYLTCRDDKQWGGDTIQDCEPLYCQRPVTTNAISNTSLNEEGTIAEYRCLDGFKYADNTTVKVFTCLNDYWQPPSFQCIRKRCPPHSVPNATANQTVTYTDEGVKFTCNKGRQFPDTRTRRSMFCQDNEEWDHHIMENCERKKCVDPPPNNTYSRTHNHNSSITYKYQMMITYTCIADWTFTDIDLSTTRNATCNEDGVWYPQNVGECVGDPIEVVTVYHPPVEEKNAEVYGSIGYIMIAVALVCLIVLDLTTIGKHIALMKARIKNDQEVLKKHREERRLAMIRKKAEKEKKERKKPKTVINTKEYIKKLAMQRAMTNRTLMLEGLRQEQEDEQNEKFTVLNELNAEDQMVKNPEQTEGQNDQRPTEEIEDGETRQPSPEQRPETGVDGPENKGEPLSGHQSPKQSAGLKSRDSKQSMAVFHGEQSGEDTAF